ncbi:MULTISPECIES: ABC transporter permease [Staphylococcus]|jgi:ABC-2 type transport system permease protein|uniref:ABC transporter permease n=1 Tax=Staphylococcus TaxID=1279 RepID=UPI0016432671|nr:MULTISPECIES: ABC transporter permease [Staphylococcus]MBC2922088.1 ABC transporter permease [Staphylococcus saprophyticus]MBC2958650.1 ABC transporter permease [Staphylococcus saprophyticus]MBC3010527.1 ABC transporter permease [Staphylococcus saprophyticus]MBC3024408.1 ABC transporter permease [Staphylococcus saprophyticus]MBC3031641.1 ABC transporter permease [Staphylococcus saprophyticus]
MAVTAFATRNRKEILRDPLSIVFGIGFPLVILILLSFLQKSLPGMSDIFAIENFVPGIAVFGLTFISLFSGMLISGDRSSSYLMRLFTSPLSGIDYIIGYSYPLLPMAILQSAICFLTGVILGMPVSVNILFSIVALIPVAVLFISIGLMMGSVLSQKQMNGAGAILTNSVVFLGGIVIPLNTIGGTFQTICNLLPFVHAVDLVQSVLSDNYSEVFQHLWWVLGYTAVIFILAVIFFKKKMKG